jgi:DNA-binding GntR family transcriptional regulator
MTNRETFLEASFVREQGPARSPMEYVYELLRTAIVSRQIPNGVWLRQRQLANEMNVSQTTVRHALNRLAAEGFVTSEPYRGFRTNIPSPHYMLDHGEVLKALEPVALRLAADRITPEALDRMEELLPKTMPGTWDLDVVHRADHDFHFIAFSACGRPYLTRLLDQTWDKYHSVGIAALYEEDDLADWARCAELYHGQILQALREGDGATAASAAMGLWAADIARDQEIFKRVERQGRALP